MNFEGLKIPHSHASQTRQSIGAGHASLRFGRLNIHLFLRGAGYSVEPATVFQVNFDTAAICTPINLAAGSSTESNGSSSLMQTKTSDYCSHMTLACAEPSASFTLMQNSSPKQLEMSILGRLLAYHSICRSNRKDSGGARALRRVRGHRA